MSVAESGTFSGTSKKLPYIDSPFRLSGQLKDHILEKIVTEQKKIQLEHVEYALQKVITAEPDKFAKLVVYLVTYMYHVHTRR